MKKNNKGFTLVELIVVLVILAILAAILVPALLGWIDKAREKQATTNAEAAYVAAQGLATELYGVSTKKTPSELKLADVQAYVVEGKIAYLTDIGEAFDISIDAVAGDGKKACKITQFTYKNAEYTAVWKSEDNGNWTVTKQDNSDDVATYSEITDTTSGK